MKIFSVLAIMPWLCFAGFKVTGNQVEPFNFSNYPLSQFVDDYAKAFNKTIISKSLRDQKDKTINFNLNKSIDKGLFQKLFYTVLESKGLSIIEDGAISRIVESRDMRYFASDFYLSDNFPKENRFMLVFHELKNPLAREITRNMRPFMSKYGRIINFKDGHSIIINDTGSNISELLALINELDSKDGIKRLSERSKKKLRAKKISKGEKDIEIEVLTLEKKLLEKKLLKKNSKVVKETYL